MNAAARRVARRRDWPRGLYEPRPGYYVWRHPHTKETFALGYVPLAHARTQAIAANQHIADSALPDLVAMIKGETQTMAALVVKIPAPAKASSAKTFRALDKIITGALGNKLCGELTVKDCADLISSIHASGKEHQAQAVRGRLSTICRRAQEMGWMQTNPAAVTAKPRASVSRSRLSLDQFNAILEHATEFLPQAMLLALITGQDRSTVAAMKRSDVKDGRLICQRKKTAGSNAPIAIPLSLRLDAIGLSLEDVLKKHRRLVPHFVHHTVDYPGTPAGSPVHVDTISEAFTAARKAAKIDGADGKEPPTFHEIRSLAKRLYKAQGGVDTKTLLGHSTEAMSELYEDARDETPIEVQINLKS